jgi:hypothetical protein
VTIAKRPSGRRDGEGYATDLGEARNEKFFAAGLDSKIVRQPVGQITLIVMPRMEFNWPLTMILVVPANAVSAIALIATPWLHVVV